MATNNLCEDCHTVTAWSPYRRVNHNDVIGTCSSCHNGTIAQGKPRDHVSTSQACGACHRTTTWDR